MAAALAVSLPGRTTELEIQKGAPPYTDGKPDALVCVRETVKRKITKQRIM
jgi:hypothetical protein